MRTYWNSIENKNKSLGISAKQKELVLLSVLDLGSLRLQTTDSESIFINGANTAFF